MYKHAGLGRARTHEPERRQHAPLAKLREERMDGLINGHKIYYRDEKKKIIPIAHPLTVRVHYITSPM